MPRYFIHLSYKGTRYAGWQTQQGQRSVQQTIENALTQLNSNQKVEITGCGRTDTGVHASSFYAHFDSATEIDVIHYKRKLNIMLPSDIAVFDIFAVKEDNHARYNAVSRTYEYRIHHSKDPFLAEISYLHKPTLNVSKINEACKVIADHTDFEAFSKVNTQVNHFNCTIKEIAWTETDEGHLFTITADRFLRNMVRAIVGTLIEVGLEKMTPEQVDAIIRSKNRSNAGKSVPAEGLTLVNVEYSFISKNTP